METLYSIKETLDNKLIFFCYYGPVYQNILIEFGSLLKKKMNIEKASLTTISSTFSMLIEQSQNIIHYSAEKTITGKQSDNNQKDLSIGIISAGYEDGHFFIQCSNMIENNKISKLKKHLAALRGMSRDELKKSFRTQRKMKPEKDSKGAGLGLIEVAKRACSPIEYSFAKSDGNFSFFSIKTSC
jgi:hypothetical protein